jgi:dual specificity tyrosine-phosphorylation-regulated kinase 2/3/4
MSVLTQSLNKFIENKVIKGAKLHNEFLEKASILSGKVKDSKVNTNTNFKQSFKPQVKKSFVQESNSYLIKHESPNASKTNLNKSQRVINPLASGNVQSSRNDRRKSLAKSRESFLSNPQQPNSTTSQRPKFPMSATQALKYFMREMNSHETTEILDYKIIYYLGQNADKINGGILKTPNHGFDDEHSDYKIVINDQIWYRYQIIGHLGKGSFGQAIKWYDNKEHKFIWLKIIKSKKRFFKQGLIEVKILKFLTDAGPEEMHNGVTMEDSFIFRNHLCIVFELLSINLYEFLKKNNFSGVSLSLVKRFAVQLLMCLDFLHDHQIIHWDLKPENIMLVKEDRSKIKIIDFGSGCFEAERMYTYIQSRFYRSPEVILGIPYTTAIDMWSLGCIIWELLLGYPIFPGQDEYEQMARIMEIMDVPPENVLKTATRKEFFFHENNSPILKPTSSGKIRYPNTRDMSKMLGVNDEVFLDFLYKTLDWNPETRITPIEALQHEWIKQDFPPHLFAKD